MVRLAFLTCVSSLAVTASAVSGELPPQRYCTAKRVAVAPAVDGVLDEAIWKSAAWQSGYVLAKKGGAASEQTRFAAVYTDDALYLAVDSLDREPEKIHPEPNDAEWWYVDIAEVFVSAGGDDVLHLIYSARGHRHEEIPGRIRLRNAGKETWSAASKIGRKGWMCEFKVPLAMIGLNPGDRYVTVPFNICRCLSRKREFSSWNFAPVMFSSVAGFGRLVFEGRQLPRPELTGSEVTFSCWAKTGLPEKDAPRGRGAYALLSWGPFKLVLNGSCGLESEFGTSRDGTGYQFVTRADIVPFFDAGEWTHYAASYSLKSGETALWVNGQHVGSRRDDLLHRTKLLPLVPPVAKADFVIGSLGGGYFPVDGEITGVRVYDHAVTAEELSKAEEPVWKQLEPDATSLADLRTARRTRRAAEADRLFQSGRTLRYSIVDVLGREMFKWDTPLKEETLDKPLKIVSTPGEFESAGFIVRSKNAVKDFLPVVSELKDGHGNVLPASTVDLRIAKVIVRALSAESNVRLLRPTVLLHDDKLLKVDEKEMKNLMRYDFPSGSKYVSVSEPRHFLGGQRAILKVEDHPIYDAKTLQPADLPDHRTIEYWATSHVPATAKPGVYRGEIALRTVSGESFGSVPVELTVLPFSLPEAKTRYDPSRVYERGIYHRVGDMFDTRPGSKGTIGQRMRNESQVRAELRNMAEHGIQHTCFCMGLPMPYWKGDPDCYTPTNGGKPTMPTEEERAYFRKYVSMMKEAGLSTDPLYVFSYGNLGFRDNYDRATMKGDLAEVGRMLKAYLMENLGHTNVFFYGVDEAHGDSLTREFNFWEDAGRLGFRFYTTIMHQNIPRVAGRISLASVSHAMDKKSAKDLHDAGTRIWSYANPQSVLLSEPFPFRVNYGLGIWLSNFDGYGVYAYNESNFHPWNCWDGWEYSYAFQTADGVCDVLNWEGQREAYDDVRYATKLLELCRAKPDSPVAVEALAWLDELDPTHPTYDPNAVREKIIAAILKLL